MEVAKTNRNRNRKIEQDRKKNEKHKILLHLVISTKYAILQQNELLKWENLDKLIVRPDTGRCCVSDERDLPVSNQFANSVLLRFTLS